MARVAGWSRDGKSLFVHADAVRGPRGASQIYRLSLDGECNPASAAEPLPIQNADHILVTAGSNLVVGVGVYTLNPHVGTWRGYAGGQIGQLWLQQWSKDGGADGKAGWKRGLNRVLPDFNIACPMLVDSKGGRGSPLIYFIGCPVGSRKATANLYSISLADISSARPQRLTNHSQFHSRQACLDFEAQCIVYQCGADIYRYSLAESRDSVLRWRRALGAPGSGMLPFRVHSCFDSMTEMDLHPRGHSLACVIRGTLWELSTVSGPAVQLGSSGVRYSGLAYLYDGSIFVAADDGRDASSEIRYEVHTGGLAAANESGGDAGSSFRDCALAGPIGPPTRLSIDIQMTQKRLSSRSSSGGAVGGSKESGADSGKDAKTSKGATKDSHSDESGTLGTPCEVVASPLRSQVVLVNRYSQLIVVDFASDAKTGNGGDPRSGASERDKRGKKGRRKRRGQGKDKHGHTPTENKSNNQDMPPGSVKFPGFERNRRARAVVIDKSRFECGISGVCYSPCGRFIAYAFRDTAASSQIRIARVASSKGVTFETRAPVSMTSGASFLDGSPCWDPAGQFLYFLSQRAFAPADDAIVDGAMGFRASEVPMLLPLSRPTKSPFVHAPRMPGGSDSGSEDDESSDSSESSSDDESERDRKKDQVMPQGVSEALASAEQTKIDFRGAAARVRAIHGARRGRYKAAFGVRGGGVLLLRSSVGSGVDVDADDYDSDNSDGSGEGSDLVLFDIASRSESRVRGGVKNIVLTPDARSLLLILSDELRVEAAPKGGSGASGSIDSDDDSDDVESGDEGMVGALRSKGRVRLDERVSVLINPRLERAQMLKQAWRDVGELYYRSDMRGLPWKALLARYQSTLLPRVSSSSDMCDLLTQLVGELGNSHCNVMPGSDAGHSTWGYSRAGSVGAAFAWDEAVRGYRVTHLTRGDMWSQRMGGPLTRLAVDVRVGDVVVAVNRRVLTPVYGPQVALATASGKELLLTVLRPLDQKSTSKSSSSKLTSNTPSTASNGGLSKSAKKKQRRRRKKDRQSLERKTPQRMQSAPATLNSAIELSPVASPSPPTPPSNPSATTPTTPKSSRDATARRAPTRPEPSHGSELPVLGTGECKRLRARARGIRTVRVRAVSPSRAADMRYRDWVRANRAAVRSASRGRVGYVHVPEMDKQGFAEWTRSFAVESARDALVVDLRGNEGGWCSPLILDVLSRRAVGVEMSRFASEPYPKRVPSARQILVVLIDGETCSDGEYLAAAVRARGLGTLIGTRTWGGVNGISETCDLVDGTEVTVPTSCFFAVGVGWKIEGKGVAPDIEVPFPPVPSDWVTSEQPVGVGPGPSDVKKGGDPQLARSVAEAVTQIEAAKERGQRSANESSFLGLLAAARAQTAGS